ncbi:uncharacterized protein ISCGN_027109 [Ixodes scapularis]
MAHMVACFRRLPVCAWLEMSAARKAKYELYCTRWGDRQGQFSETFGLSADGEKSYQVVEERFVSHFVAARNIVYKSACFHRRSQKPGETVDQFVTALHTLAESCDFQDFKERMIYDRFVVGPRDAKLSETLQIDADLTLATALAKARLKETVHQQQQELQPGAGDNAVISAAETEVDFVAKKPSSTQDSEAIVVGVRRSLHVIHVDLWLTLRRSDVSRLNLTVTLSLSPGYTLKNILSFQPQGQDISVPAYSAYKDIKTCDVLRVPYAGDGACAILVPKSQLGSHGVCCDFIFDLLCGATPKFNISDSNCP